ncbi:hypothetical protein HMI56_000239 [Coelomomyces lativittatus]|nr:hypothetical protein HMI56_000239 [Coelomomyces lativittatus]
MTSTSNYPSSTSFTLMDPPHPMALFQQPSPTPLPPPPPLPPLYYSTSFPTQLHTPSPYLSLPMPSYYLDPCLPPPFPFPFPSPSSSTSSILSSSHFQPLLPPPPSSLYSPFPEPPLQVPPPSTPTTSVPSLHHSPLEASFSFSSSSSSSSSSSTSSASNPEYSEWKSTTSSSSNNESPTFVSSLKSLLFQPSTSTTTPTTTTTSTTTRSTTASPSTTHVKLLEPSPLPCPVPDPRDFENTGLSSPFKLTCEQNHDLWVSCVRCGQSFLLSPVTSSPIAFMDQKHGPSFCDECKKVQCVHPNCDSLRIPPSLYCSPTCGYAHAQWLLKAHTTLMTSTPRHASTTVSDQWDHEVGQERQRQWLSLVSELNLDHQQEKENEHALGVHDTLSNKQTGHVGGQPGGHEEELGPHSSPPTSSIDTTIPGFNEKRKTSRSFVSQLEKAKVELLRIRKLKDYHTCQRQLEQLQRRIQQRQKNTFERFFLHSTLPSS